MEEAVQVKRPQANLAESGMDRISAVIARTPRSIERQDQLRHRNRGRTDGSDRFATSRSPFCSL